jgi:CBS domain-containing protein
MKRNVPVRTVMSTELSTVNVTDKVSEVRRLLAEQAFHHVPVVSGKKLVGMISATDMVKLSLSAYGADQRAVDAMLDHEFTIEQIMVKTLHTLGEKRTVREAAEMLGEGSYHSLPIVSDEGELVGMVTSTDIIRYLVDQY